MGIDDELKVVADIGQNHNGDMAEAQRLIDVAAEAGVWGVKGQKRSVVQPEWDRPYDSPYSYGKTYADHRAALELTISQHRVLHDYASKKGLRYFVSAFDHVAAQEAWDAEFEYLKIPSSLLTDPAMRFYLTDPDSPPDRGHQFLILSTGMAHDEEMIDVVIDLRPDYVLQCTSAYPCPPAAVHLRAMQRMRIYWPSVAVGFSSHSLGIHIELAAAMLGAKMIEVHITMDRAGRGRDHAFSKEPGQLQKLMRNINQCYEALGDPLKKMLPCEVEAAKRLGRPIPDHLS